MVGERETGQKTGTNFPTIGCCRSGRRRAGRTDQLDEDTVSLHQIDHGVKSVIPGDHVMSRSDVGNYRPLATHVEDTAARTLRLPAPRLRSNSNQGPPRRQIAIESLGDDVNVSRDVSENTAIAVRRDYDNSIKSLFHTTPFAL